MINQKAEMFFQHHRTLAHRNITCVLVMGFAALGLNIPVGCKQYDKKSQALASHGLTVTRCWIIMVTHQCFMRTMHKMNN